MEKKNIIIIILFILVIGLFGYIIYDKLSNDKENKGNFNDKLIEGNEINNDSNINNNNDVNNETFEENNSSDSKERPYVDGKITIYSESNEVCHNPETTISLELGTNKKNKLLYWRDHS